MSTKTLEIQLLTLLQMINRKIKLGYDLLSLIIS